MQVWPKLLLVCALVAMASGRSVSARTLEVPQEYPTIQAALDEAVSGDEIVLAPGRYGGVGNTRLAVVGQSLTVRSETGPASTVIEGGGHADPQSGFLLKPRTGNVVRIIGLGFERLTAVNGSAIRALDSGEVIVEDCSFIECEAPEGDQDPGGAVVVGNAVDATFRNCYFSLNQAMTGAAGLHFVSTGSCRVEDSDFEANHPGGVWFMSNGGSGVVANCRLRHNSGAAIVAASNTMVEIRDSVIIDNAKGIAANGNVAISRCTVANNAGRGITVGLDTSVLVERSIVQRNCPSDIHAFGDIQLSCCGVDSAGIVGWEFVSLLDDQVWDYAQFCDPEPCGGYNDASWDRFLLHVDSPCTAWRSPCGETLGAMDAGCGSTELGACCVGEVCFIASSDGCASASGEFVGEGVACETDTCVATPVVPMSWGEVKRLFR